MPKRLEIALPVIKKDYIIMIKKFLIPEGHQNPVSGSKDTAILLKGWIWPIGGVASGRVCAYSLHSRLLFKSYNKHGQTKTTMFGINYFDVTLGLVGR